MFFRMLPEVNGIPFFSPVQTRGHSEFGIGESRGLAKPLSRYDLDDLDVSWLELVNAEFRQLGTIFNMTSSQSKVMMTE